MMPVLERSCEWTAGREGQIRLWERRVLVGCGDPPDPRQAGFAGTIYLVQVCKQHDPDPRRSVPMPRLPDSLPIGQHPRR